MNASPPPRLAIFQRHSLLDGRPPAYVSRPGAANHHPYLGAPPFNVGDNFVSLALAKALNVEEFLVMTHGAPERYFDYMNENCDALIFVAQNSLYPGFFGKFLPRNFVEKRIRIPIIFVSLGLQFELDETPHLLPEDVESLKVIHERCVSSQVRGEQTAELLARYGVTNTRILGCPSLLWSLDPKLKLRKPSWDRVGWTITNMGARPGMDALQTEAIARLSSRAKTFVPIAQGGEVALQDYIIARDGMTMGDRTDEECVIPVGGEAEFRPFTQHWRDPSKPPEWSAMRCRLDRWNERELRDAVAYQFRELPGHAIQSVLNDSFFSFYTHEYMRNARSLSLMAGTRLHGNIMALSQGVPSVFMCHDRRLEEVAALMNAPRYNLNALPSKIDLAKLDFRACEHRLQELYQGFRAFFAENGLAHCL